MKTTLNIDGGVMARLKQEAARQGRTMSELVEMALRLLLETRNEPSPDLPELPRLSSGGLQVDISDREALYKTMGDR